MPPALCGEPKILNLMSSENIVAKIRVTKKAESIKRGKYTGFFHFGTDMDVLFLYKNSKNKKEIKSAKVILNKLTRLQSLGWKVGGRTTMGKNRIKQAPHKNKRRNFFCEI